MRELLRNLDFKFHKVIIIKFLRIFVSGKDKNVEDFWR